MQSMKETKYDFATPQMKIYLDTLQALSDSTGDYLYLWELEKNRAWTFGKIAEKYDLKNSGNIYNTLDEWQDIIHKHDLPAVAENLAMIERGETTVHNMDYRVRNRRGAYVWINCSGNVLKDETGHPFALIGRLSDTVLQNKIDSLTGLFNIDKMFEDLHPLLETWKTGYLLVLDVDNLKKINIARGREYGSWMLKCIADVLQNIAGDLQKVYRLFGDFFAITMPGAEQENVQDLFDKIQKAVAPGCTLSAGAASFNGYCGKDKRRLYQHAEDALDRAKQEGKNQLVFFSEEDYGKKVSEIALIKELERSVLNNCEGFTLAYQSQIKGGSYHLFGAETLLRYESPTRGRVMPNEFIPLLEQTELIYPVGLWVLQKALEQCREWRKVVPDFHISVNMSYVQLKNPEIKEQVLDILERSGVPGEALTVEITESMQLQDFRYYNGIFSEWKQAGILISVDDFGTGYSSLGYLKNLKVDEIKIDRCFVRGIQSSGYNYKLLSNMLELAADSEMYVCCEGVEKEEELQVLEKLNPDLLQGYLFSKPCEKEEFEKNYLFQGISC